MAAETHLAPRDPSPDLYDAFISYSHEDEPLARRLSRRIRSYRPPRQVQTDKRKLTVFRDVERFTASPDLAGALTERVTASRRLILLASPDAAKSPYVDQELRQFAAANGIDNLIVVLCRGTPAEAIPPSLREANREPLYIDLRPRGQGLWSRSSFNGESLRIIAALLGVDYSELRREDEKRHVRRRNGLISATVLTAALLWSAFLILAVPQEAWMPVNLPASHAGSPLMPIQQYAVYRPDPSVLFFHARDANYESQKPKRPIGLFARSIDVDLKKFAQLALEPGQNFQQPSAVLRFTIDDPTGARIASGEMDVFAFLHLGTGQVRYVRTLRLNRETPGHPPKPLELPPTADTEAITPFELDPWPLDPLIKEDLLPVGGFLRGSIANRLEGRDVKVEYEIVDLQQSFVEANDGMWFKEKVLSSAPDRTVALGGSSISLDDIDGEWDELAATPELAAYRPPAVVKYERLGVLLQDKSGNTLAGRLGDKSLADVLRPLLTNDPDVDCTAVVVKRRDANRTFAAATLVTRIYNEVAHLLERRKVNYLIHNPGHPQWHTVNLREGVGEIVDVIPLDVTGNQLVVATETGGLLRTLNGGETWSDFNLGEDRLLAGRSIRIIASTPAIYTLVDSAAANPSATNFLFRHNRRGWLDRLRIALINLLSRPGRAPARGQN